MEFLELCIQLICDVLVDNMGKRCMAREAGQAGLPEVQYTDSAIFVSFLMVSRNFAAAFPVPIWPTMNFTPTGWYD